jgi:phosphatidylglycerophosphate synthase
LTFTEIAGPRGGRLDTMLDYYADLAVVLAITFAYSSSHPGPFAMLGGLVFISGYLMGSYATKEFAMRYGKAYPPDFLTALNAGTSGC